MIVPRVISLTDRFSVVPAKSESWMLNWNDSLKVGSGEFETECVFRLITVPLFNCNLNLTFVVGNNEELIILMLAPERCLTCITITFNNTLSLKYVIHSLACGCLVCSDDSVIGE